MMIPSRTAVLLGLLVVFALGALLAAVDHAVAGNDRAPVAVAVAWSAPPLE